MNEQGVGSEVGLQVAGSTELGALERRGMLLILMNLRAHRKRLEATHQAAVDRGVAIMLAQSVPL